MMIMKQEGLTLETTLSMVIVILGRMDAISWTPFKIVSGCSSYHTIIPFQNDASCHQKQRRTRAPNKVT